MNPSGKAGLAIPSVYVPGVDGNSEGMVLYSTNGTTYTTVSPVPSGLPINGAKLGKIVSNGAGLYVAVQEKQKYTVATEVYVSENPLIGWDAYTLSFSPRGICFDGTNFIICGDGGNIAYTSNPRGTWTSWSSGVSVRLNDIAYAESRWAVCGVNNGSTGILRVATTLGGSWTSRFNGTGTNTALNCITTDGTNWLCGGQSALFYSTHANVSTTNWSRVTLSYTAMGVEIGPTEMAWVGNQGRRGYATIAAPTTWADTAPFGGDADMKAIKYSPALGLWIAAGEYVLRTNTSLSTGSWTSRSTSIAAAEGLYVTG